MKLDDQALERIIEQITRQVLVLVQEQSDDCTEGGSPLSTGNYVHRVQPVVSAGADRIAATLGVAPTNGELSHMIDHTLLKADATQDEIAQLCYEARKHDFASVCVNPSYVKLCADLLDDTKVLVCTVVGFPLGATSTEAKTFETQKAVRDGATEVDMVINVGALKSRDYEVVEGDIASIARACHAGGAILKVIIEAALLTDEEKVRLGEIMRGVLGEFLTEDQWVKTVSDVLADHFTVGEIDALTKFYKSPAGVRFMELEATLTRDIDDRVGDAFDERFDAFAARVDEELSRSFEGLSEGGE